MTKPVVSIVMPVYNGAATIEASIESVLAQTYPDWELIVVSDNSTDRTVELVQTYCSRDQRIVLLNQSRRLGVADSCNLAIAQARGDFFCRLDSDDVWVDPDKVKKQVDFLNSNPGVGLLGTWALAGRESSRPKYYFRHPLTDEAIRSRMLVRNMFVSSSIMARLELVRRCGGYHKEDGLAEDYGLNLRLGLQAKTANLPALAVWYRLNAAGLSQASNLGQVSSAYTVVQKFRKEYPYYWFANIKWQVQVWLSRWAGVKAFNLFKRIVYH